MIIRRFTAIVLMLAALLAPFPRAKALGYRPAAPTAITWYVDQAATGANTGGSWADAYTLLQPALAAAQPGDQIWVAQGVYTPTNTTGLTATFALKAGVALYGGFDPASGAYAWEERDWQAYPSVLSGDLDGNDITDPNGVLTSTANIVGNNAYHVLSTSGLTQTARLDGFYVTAGNADGSDPYDCGGGMRNVSSSPSLVNVAFSANQATEGGGMYNNSSSPSLANITFSANQADYGGGMYNNSSSPSLANVTFSINQASSGGGMVNMSNSSPSLVNVTFSANQASSGGGVVNMSSSPAISNSILWGNSGAQIYNDASSPTIRYSNVQGGCPSGSTCENLMDADPLFRRTPSYGPDALWGTTDDDYGDLRLQLISPAIDAGNNLLAPLDEFDLDGNGNTSERIPLDLDGARRFVDIPWIVDSGVSDPPSYPAVVDMGAYETLYANLALHKSASASALLPGQALSYTLAFSNTGVLTATQAWISDTLPAELQILGYQVSPGLLITPTGAVSYTWQTGDLAPTAGGVITISARLPTGLPGGYVFTNTAQIGTPWAERFLADNRSQAALTVLNAAPSADDDVFSVVQGSTGNILDVLAGDSDLNNDTLQVFAVGAPDHGGTASDNDINILYTPAASFSGVEVFTYTISDGHGGFGAAQVTVTVGCTTFLPLVMTSKMTWYVDHAATGVNTGKNWADAFTRLQSALEAAQPGDKVFVAQGIYTPTNTIGRTATFTLTNGVALYGGFDPASGADTLVERDWLAHPTVLSGDLDGNDIPGPNGVLTSTANITGTNAYHVLSSSSLTQTARLNGFYVTAGNADGGMPPYDRGGGVYNYDSSPRLVNVAFSANQAAYGGGVYNYDSSPRLVNVVFTANQAGKGGGMYNDYYSSPSLSNVTFTANQANNDEGGGMYNVDHSSPSLVNVVFSANQAGYGGGMYNYNKSSPSLSNVTFTTNQAGSGGGMCNNDSDPSLSNVTFTANRADNSGGGMHNYVSSPNLSDVTFSDNQAGSCGGMCNNDSDPSLSNVTFTANRASWDGGGMCNNDSDPSLSNVTFSANQANYEGGGMFNADSDPSLVNVTFTTNQANQKGGGMYNDSYSSPSLSHVTFTANQAGWSGGGMYNYYKSRPNLVNVTFTANQASSGGGGMYNEESSPSLVNVTFSANQADWGGGMFNLLSSPSLVNATFTANRATHYDGGGMYNMYCNPSLSNVTFTANQAGQYGGGISNSSMSHPTIYNSILWGNTAPNGAVADQQIYNYDYAIIRYSDVQGGCPTGATCSHLINANPLFKRLPSPGPDGIWGTADDNYGDLRLGPGSPAINTGNNAYLPTDKLDLDGDGNTSELLPLDLDMLLRIFRGVVDMGAYEAH